jgi:hypothetical protein
LLNLSNERSDQQTSNAISLVSILERTSIHHTRTEDFRFFLRSHLRTPSERPVGHRLWNKEVASRPTPIGESLQATYRARGLERKMVTLLVTKRDTCQVKQCYLRLLRPLFACAGQRACWLVVCWCCCCGIRKEGFITRAKHRVTAALRDQNYTTMHEVSQKRYSGSVWMALGLGVEVRQCVGEARNTEFLVRGMGDTLL